MNLDALQTNVLNYAHIALEATKQFTATATQYAQQLNAQFITPAVAKITEIAKAIFQLVRHAIQTRSPMPFAIATALFFTGIIAFKIADSKAYDECRWSKTAWKVAGVASFVAATLASSIGIAAFMV